MLSNTRLPIKLFLVNHKEVTKQQKEEGPVFTSRKTFVAMAIVTKILNMSKTFRVLHSYGLLY